MVAPWLQKLDIGAHIVIERVTPEVGPLSQAVHLNGAQICKFLQNYFQVTS